MKKILSLMALSLLISSVAFAQVSFQVNVTVTNGTFNQVLQCGINGDGPGGTIDDNTFGVDFNASYGSYQEAQLPPLPPSYQFDARFTTNPGRVTTYPTGLGTGTLKNFYGFASSVQVDTFQVRVTGDNTDLQDVVISWPSGLNAYGTAWELRVNGNPISPVNMLTSTSATIPAGSGGNYTVRIIKTGAMAPAPGPTFVASVEPGAQSAAPVNFGTANIGSPVQRTLRITNTGSANTLNLTAITPPSAPFSIVGGVPSLPIPVAPGAFADFVLEYAPTGPGTDNGTIEFTHNGPGSPSTINLTGSASSNANLLVFDSTSRFRNDVTPGIVDSISIKSWTGPATIRAIQFIITSDSGKLRFISAAPGDRVNDASKWSFQYEIEHGPLQTDYSTDDTLKVVILGLNDSIVAPETTLRSLVKFTYETVNILTDSVRAQLSFRGVLASTVFGGNAGLTAGGVQSILIRDRGEFLKGDVNGDGDVNILDLLLIIDHILNRITLTGDSFVRGDIADENLPNVWPAPDGEINVADLTRIQGIILSGQYPDGSPVGKRGADNMSADAPVSFQIEQVNGKFQLRMNNSVAVKGVQFQVNDVNNAAPFTSEFGSAFTKLVDGNLRAMVYNMDGRVVEAGSYVIEMPISANHLSDASFTNVVVADANNNSVAYKFDGKTAAQTVASEFALYQNYPNPFNPSTTITFNVPTTSQVRISVFNSLGQEVRTLFNGEMAAGVKTLTWDGRDNGGNLVNSGAFGYRMTADGFSAERAMVFAK